jgi:FkbM family methyltransferase
LTWWLVEEANSLWCLAQTEPAEERRGLIRAYLRVLADLGGASSASRETRILDMTVHYRNRWAMRKMLSGIFLRQEYAFAASNATPFIVDAGANIGLATLFFKHRYPDARVIAFEPEPEAFELLRRNVQDNRLTEVTVLDCALGETDGSVRLRGNPAGLGTTTLDGVWDSPKTDLVVELKRLSSFLETPVDMLKLDVEGAEHAILHDLVAASKLELVREMLIEYHHNITAEEGTLGELLTLLEDNGFAYQVSASFNQRSARRSLRIPSRTGIYQDVIVYAQARSAD